MARQIIAAEGTSGADVACTFVKGACHDLLTEVELWAVPGMDGVGSQRLGRRGGPFRFTLILYETEANVAAWAADVAALQGQVVRIVDDFELTYYHCLITSVSLPIFAAARPAAGSSQTYDTRGEIVIAGVTTAAQAEAEA